MNGLGKSLVIVDIETSGLDPARYGILSIGARHVSDGGEFYIEPRLYLDQLIDPEALAVNGFTKEQAHDVARPTQGQAVRAFFAWLGPVAIMGGMNVGKFDWAFIDAAARREGMDNPFSHRTLDLHTLAVAYAIRNGIAVPEDGLKTDAVYAMLGLPPEPKPHNALTGAQREWEAFRMLLPVVGEPAPRPEDKPQRHEDTKEGA